MLQAPGELYVSAAFAGALGAVAAGRNHDRTDLLEVLGVARRSPWACARARWPSAGGCRSTAPARRATDPQLSRMPAAAPCRAEPRRVLRPAPRALQAQDAHRTRARRRPSAPRRGSRPARPAPRPVPRPQQFHPLAPAMHQAPGNGDSPGSAGPPPRRAAPVHPRLGLVDLGGIGDAGSGCGSGRRLSSRASASTISPAPIRDSRSCRLPAVSSRPDRRGLAQQHRPGIEARLHRHDAHAGLGIPGHDRALDGRRPPPARQQARMDVQTARAGACPAPRAAGSGRKPPPPPHPPAMRRIPPARPRSRRLSGWRTGSPSASARACTGLGPVALAPPRRARRLAIDGHHLVPGDQQARPAPAPKIPAFP